jgi:hypothetical protein
VTVDDTIVASQYVRLRFSASPRQVEVTAPGEMKYEAGRDYKGRWLLSWD